MLSLRSISLLPLVVMALGALHCSPSSKPSPSPSGSASAQAGVYNPEAEAQRRARVAAVAQRAEPCSAGHEMQCSDNEKWFNCSCQDKAGHLDPARPFWTQVAEPDRVLGRMWMFRTEGGKPPAVLPEHQARWGAIQADLRQRLGDASTVSNLRITRRDAREDWEVIAHARGETCTVNYDGAGVFQKQRCDRFIPD